MNISSKDFPWDFAQLGAADFQGITFVAGNWCLGEEELRFAESQAEVTTALRSLHPPGLDFILKVLLWGHLVFGFVEEALPWLFVLRILIWACSALGRVQGVFSWFVQFLRHRDSALAAA